jgi:fructokinase
MTRTKPPVVCFGEVLWDLLPSGARPGGAPMNVAYHLQKLGIRTALISRVGKDPLGEQLVQILKANGLRVDYVQQDPVHPTGIVHATMGIDNEVSYDIVQPVAWDFISLEHMLFSLVEDAEYMLFGSLVARNAVSRHTLFSLIEAARKRVVDINLRKPFFDKQLVETLLRSADILKLNEHELYLISSWYKELDEEEDMMRFLQDLFSIPLILVTCGKDGAMVCNQGKLSKHKGYKVHVADTVGSGDAFLAGFLSQTLKGAAGEKALSFANATGAFIASRQGACPPYQPEEILKLMEQEPTPVKTPGH